MGICIYSGFDMKCFDSWVEWVRGAADTCCEWPCSRRRVHCPCCFVDPHQARCWTRNLSGIGYRNRLREAFFLFFFLLSFFFFLEAIFFTPCMQALMQTGEARAGGLGPRGWRLRRELLHTFPSPSPPLLFTYFPPPSPVQLH